MQSPSPRNHMARTKATAPHPLSSLEYYPLSHHSVRGERFLLLVATRFTFGPFVPGTYLFSFHGRNPQCCYCWNIELTRRRRLNLRCKQPVYRGGWRGEMRNLFIETSRFLPFNQLSGSL